MKPILLIAFLFICAAAFAQKPMRPIDEQLTSQGERVFLNEEKLKPGQVKYYYRDEPKSLSLYKSARLISGINIVVGTAGGLCTGWELGKFLAIGEVNGVVLGTGLGLVAACIALQVVTNNKVKKSVELYNGTKTAALRFEYGLIGSGIGVGVRF